jgi:Tol biopolymer transport system component
MSLAVGHQLGPYEIVSPLADGGMGELYRALDSRLGRMVAVKILPPSVAADADRLRRFEQEARATGALDHPNVLVVHDFGSHEGAPYLVTELLEGETLRERMARGPVPARKAAEIAARVAHGLAAAHGKHIVHRDLKPDNVFLTRDGRVKILDFGLAKVKGPLGVDTDADTLVQRPAGEATSPGLLLGTAAYMAPEQVRGEEADGRSDVFALGAILYEMLTHRRAFARGSMAETLSAILREDPPDMARLSGAVPRALQSVLRRCLEKDPADRFQSARDLGFALDALAQGADSDAHRMASADITSVFRGVSVRLGLHRLGWPQAAALALLGLAAGLLAGWLAHPAPRPRIVGYRALASGEALPARVATDGERLFFTTLSEGRNALWQVSLAGGRAEPIATPFRHAVVFDVSHRRGALLVAGWDGSVTGAESADQPLWILPVGGGSARNTGLRAYGAAWSPDAERIAFSGGSGDYSKGPPSSLFVAGADGSGLRKIHDAGVPIPWIHWSPDGTRLRFAVFDRASAEFWWEEIPAAGGHPQRIVRGEAGDWSPGGRHFVFGRWGRTHGSAPWEGPRFSLFARREATGFGPFRPKGEGATEPLTFGPMDFTSPVFTPDGRRLVVSGVLRRMDLLRLEPGPPARFGRVADVPGGFVDYSRDGEWVAWVDAAHLTLWRSRRDGTGQLQLTVPPMASALAHWSPDGRRLVFVADPTGGRQPRAVYVVPRDGGALESFADPGNALVWDPCWLDDDRVAWGNLYDRGSVKVLDLRTRAIATLPGSEGMMGPKCSPDGSILAAKEWSQGYHLYRPQTGQWEDLGVPSGLWYPTFTRDGSAVLGLSLDERAIFRFTLAGRRLEKVADLGSVEPTAPWMAAWMGLDPDDRPLVLRNTGVSDLYVLDWDES